MSDEIAAGLRALQGAIDRFFMDGHLNWTRRDLSIVLGTEDIDNPVIQKSLAEWDKLGIIKLVKENELYFKILKQFPD